MMHGQIKQAFDTVHAEPALKENTRAFLAACRRTSRRRTARLVPALACMLCLILGGLHLYFSPVSVISIDVNPSLELEVNRFGRIVRVVGYNEDGKALAEAVKVRFLDYASAVEKILESPMVQSCLDQDGDLSIAVVGDDETMLTALSAVTEKQSNAQCYAATREEARTAHQAGMSCGRYRAYRQLQDLDGTVTAEQVQHMSMHDIHHRIQELSGPAPADPPSQIPAPQPGWNEPEEACENQEPKKYSHNHNHGEH